MIQVISGDILCVDIQYIAHQCNCVTVRAAHLSKDVFTKFPYADIYKGRLQKKIYTVRDLPDEDRPGTIVVRGDGITRRLVINMLGQIFPGTPRFKNGIDSRYMRELYFLQCLREVFSIPVLEAVAFPFGIGCGAAGGDWRKYEVYIRVFANMYPNVDTYLVKKPS